MKITSFDDLIKLCWSKEINQNNRVHYVRPDKRKVRQRRNLTNKEKDEIGDILFPGKKKSPAPAVPTPVPAPAPAPPDSPDSHPQPVSHTLTASHTFTDSTRGTSSQNLLPDIEEGNTSSGVFIISNKAIGLRS